MLTLRGVGDGTAQTLRVDFANEYVVAFADGEPVACAPDIITFVDARSWRPVAVDQLRVGQGLRLLVLPAPEPVRAQAHRLGLAAYGFTPVTRSCA